jgi:E1A/CREB-binding protein
MHEKYAKSGCPKEFPVRTKCIALFQSINGVDVLLFAMFVYEYGHDCPAPNRRRVYISYLDSVQYFEPKSLRTTAYHTVLVEYLRFVKERGFHTAHIWSCPPTPDDDYIFHCHPKHQQVPRDDMLRSWYIEMLDKAKAEGVVLEVNNIHEEYFRNNGANSPTGDAVNPTCLPYFEGDYILGEIENIVSQVKEEESRADYIETFSSVPRPRGGKVGTRSNPGKLLNQYQDKVMLRLGKALNNMKENFLVVHLRSKKFVAAVERGEDVSNWTEGNDQRGKPLIVGKDSSVLHPRSKQSRGKEEQSSQEDDFEATTPEKSGVDEIRPALARHFAQLKSKKIGSTLDDDDILECEIFEARQPFLNYCQSNRYQFDELRKAKHTTMMVLFQLHNPMAPKFVQQCAACRREIAHGIRYHCQVCSSFDLCQSCFGSATSGGLEVSHDKSHTFARIKMDPEEQKSQEERVRSLKPHLELINHAAYCEGAPSCKLNNCHKMKLLFIHVQTCEVTYQRGCRKCSRLLGLLTVHARSCTVRGTCPLPFCDRIRERNERLRRQQQLMDDRRRQAQNELYRAGGERN